MMARGANNAVASQLEQAVARARLALGADAATRAAARGEMKASLGPGGIGRIREEHPSAMSNAAATAGGGLGSAEAGLIPYEIDRLLPEGSHGRHESDDWKNWVQRGAFGSLGGILGSRYGMEAPLLRGRVTPPVSEMEGLLAGLKAPAARAKPSVAERKPRASRRRKSENENVVPIRETGMAAGGAPDFKIQPSYIARAQARSLGHTGPINSMVPGRTDHHAMNVPSKSYVVPAHIPSALGQGNTAAGMAVLSRMFPKSGPYGSPGTPMHRGIGLPKSPKADGGAMDGSGQSVPIMAAGGEFVVSPEDVAEIGGGDHRHGHAVLDHWVQSEKRKLVKTLNRLPPPAKD